MRVGQQGKIVWSEGRRRRRVCGGEGEGEGVWERR